MNSLPSSLFPERVKSRILARVRPDQRESLDSLKGKRKIFVGLAGFYQNLGDLAITLAQTNFIADTLPGHVVIPISSKETYSLSKQLKRNFEDGDVLTLIGGGNMGDLYESLEDARLHLLRLLPRAPVVAFPQSWSFTDTQRGMRAIARSRSVYGQHRRLVIFARDRISLGRMRSAFPNCQMELAPDIVLSLEVGADTTEREGILLMLRKDIEGVLGASERQAIIEELGAVTSLDTVDVALEDCTPDRYRATLDRFFARVASHRAVVTDRLHGMIFSVLTRTPSVTLPNSTGKTAAVHQDWLATSPLVSFVGDPSPAGVRQALALQAELLTDELVVPKLEAEFEPLRQALLAAAND